ncbi:MAG: Rab family GTPase [Promethearchaeota archaeon]
MTETCEEQYRFKIVVCGDWAVGKTSLVRRYATNSFTNDYLTTIAVNFVSKEVVIDGVQVCMTIWDTGGQERFSHLRKSYYKNTHGVILVFDLTRPESFRHLEKYWLPEINSIIEGYVPAIWGTKADLAEQRVVSTSSGERLARKINAYYFETSSLTGQNVEKAFQSLGRLVLSNALTKIGHEDSFTI